MVDRPTRFQRGPIADPEKTKRDARDLEESMQGSIADHETRIAALETLTADHESRLDAAELTIADHETRLDTLEPKVASLLGTGAAIIVDEGLVSNAVAAGIIS